MSVHTSQNDTKTIVQSLKPGAQEFLCELISIPSLSGREEPAVDYCAKAFAGLADEVTKIPLHDVIRQDPDASDGLDITSYEGRNNLSVLLRGERGAPALVLNAHLDVVPPSDGQVEPFDARIVGDTIYGRGACDDKGSVSAIYLLFAAVREIGITLPVDLLVHLVVEEETSGNGTLAMVRKGIDACAAIVMEPSNLDILVAARGVVWFRIECRGKSAHSGCSATGRSALKLARKVMDILESYHSELLAESLGTPPYESHDSPMPLCFGRLSSGNWPAMAPERAILEGIIGFLPNKTRWQVKRELSAALERELGREEMEDVRVSFPVSREASGVGIDHPLVKAMLSACEAAGRSPAVSALTGSTDAWLYNNRSGIPAVIFGPGRLEDAHSGEECVLGEDIAVAAHTLLLLVQDCSGGLRARQPES